MSSALKLARGFALPLEMVTEASAIVATRGAGKSSASAVIVEEAFALGVQVVVFDRTGVYWGLRSNARGDGPGLAVYVLGGPHGDVPLEANAGALIADLVVDSGHSFVLDLSDLSKSGAIRFAADFLERLYDRKARARTTTLLVMDEAHFYAPQTPRGGFKGDSARLMGAMEDAVGLGRSRGLGVVLTTQRTQALNKAILDLIETLLVMRMLSPRARDAVQDWIREKHEDDRVGVIATLESLPTGTAWVWSPLRGILEKIAVRRIQTFDSFYAPQPGEAAVEPTARKELDLDALGERMRATVERAKADDPAELRKRIRELERQLESQPEAQPETVEVPVEVEVPVVPQEILAPLDHYEEMASQAVGELRTAISDFGLATQSVREAASALNAARESAPPAVSRVDDRPRPSPPRQAPPVRPAVSRRDDESGVAAQNGSGSLTAAQRSLLGVLAQFPEGRSKVQLGLLSGYKVKSSTLRTAIGGLRTMGLISPAGVEPITITAEGRAMAGDVMPVPTGRALLEFWLERLDNKAAREILQAMYDRYPDELSKEELETITGYAATSSTMRTALGRLRSLRLVEGSRLSEDLL